MSTDMRTRVRAGEPSAFAELFDSYARTVCNHAFRLTADWATAEDVMAATFMEAWRLRGRVDHEGGSLRLWLLGIATNTARNQTRSNRRYRAAATAAARAETAVPDHAEEVDGRVDDRRRLAAALTALAALRRPEREVLALCLWEGLEYTAAAEALGIPAGTVQVREDGGVVKRGTVTFTSAITTRNASHRGVTSPFASESDTLTQRRHVVDRCAWRNAPASPAWLCS
ncbi:RNA polymerase sigma factor [Streptomyces sp. NPDC087845]|uniref:RNA polymerase sigma factor n=1 Tax=Streptomyces sp. NPDC087845 TaxID=3365806 RepID=UPI003801665B